MLSVIAGVGLLFSAFPELVSSSVFAQAGIAPNGDSGVGVRLIKDTYDYRILDSVELPSRHLADSRSGHGELVVLVLGAGGTLIEIDFSDATAGPVKKLFQGYKHAPNSAYTYRYVGSRRGSSKGELADGNLKPIARAPLYNQWGSASYIIFDSIPTNTVITNLLSE